MPVTASTPNETIAPRADPGRPAGSFAALGALLGLGAIVSSSCCVLPLALALAGLGGAGAIAALTPAKPYLLAAGVLVLAGGWLLYLRRRAACAAGEGCVRPPARRWVPALLSLATLLFALAAAWGWIEPVLLGWLMEQPS